MDVPATSFRDLSIMPICSTQKLRQTAGSFTYNTTYRTFMCNSLAFLSLAGDFSVDGFWILTPVEALVRRLANQAIGGPAREFGTNHELGTHPMRVSCRRTRRGRRERLLVGRERGQ